MKFNFAIWIQKLWALPIIREVIIWSKKNSLPGLEGVPLYDITVFIRKELTNHDITTRANSMAFSFFLSIFPSIIMFFTFIAYLPMSEELTQSVDTMIQNIMPGETGKSIIETIESVTKQRRTGLMSLSFIFALIFASNGIFTMLVGFSKKDYKHTFKRLGFIWGRLIAIKLLVILVLTILVSIIFGIFGNTIVYYLSDHLHFGWLARWGTEILRWLVTVIIYYASISFIYRYGMLTRKKQKFFSLGTTVAAVLSLLSSLAFSFYINNYAMYNKIYGPIGTLIVTMLWIQLNSMIILIGFELNASIAINRNLRSAKLNMDDL